MQNTGELFPEPTVFAADLAIPSLFQQLDPGAFQLLGSFHAGRPFFGDRFLCKIVERVQNIDQLLRTIFGCDQIVSGIASEFFQDRGQGGEAGKIVRTVIIRQSQDLTAGADGGQQCPGSPGGQDEKTFLRRFFQRLEKGVLGVFIHGIAVLNDPDLPSGFRGAAEIKIVLKVPERIRVVIRFAHQDHAGF